MRIQISFPSWILSSALGAHVVREPGAVSIAQREEPQVVGSGVVAWSEDIKSARLRNLKLDRADLIECSHHITADRQNCAVIGCDHDERVVFVGVQPHILDCLMKLNRFLQG